MKALVVYESMFGNSEAIARSIADGLSEHCDVTVRDVSERPGAPAGMYDVIVVGGPTHAFSMSTPRSRRDATLRGGRMGVRLTGMREWITELKPPHAEVIAVFDTRVHAVRHLPGSAARAAARALRAKTGSSLSRPRSFYVEGMTGRLLDGEIERARAWGQSLALSAQRAIERPVR